MEFLKICSICLLLLLNGEKSYRGIHFYSTSATDFNKTKDLSEDATTENYYTATENPVENTTITPLAKTVYINATTNSSRTVTEETKEDPEFGLYKTFLKKIHSIHITSVYI